MMDKMDRAARMARIREIVDTDFLRISGASSPYVILNVSPAQTLDVVEERFGRYERFYRAQNFQRFQDMDLTRKALEIRRAVARAMSEIRDMEVKPGAERHDVNLFAAEEDNQAMGEIYFRDAMTYLHLGDHGEACAHLRRSMGYDRQHALTQAYLGYLLYKLRSYDQEVVREARLLLDRAAELAPQDPNVFVLRGRFFARRRDHACLEATISHLESVEPAHPMLQKLKKKAHQLAT